jgi:hypothetical protein
MPPPNSITVKVGIENRRGEEEDNLE